MLISSNQKYIHRMHQSILKKSFTLSAIFMAVALTGCGSDKQVQNGQMVGEQTSHPKNVIIMINDGAGVGTWDATAAWQYGGREGMPYHQFPAKYAMTTYPLNTSNKPTNNTESLVNYDPQKAWDTQASGNDKLPFKGYEYLSQNATDSAAAGTALASGTKTYNNAINFDNFGQPVDFITSVAKANGRATGVVTTVPFSHATPAAFGAQNISRNNYGAIANQMLSQGKLDLIMGTGAPGFNVNGTDCQKLLSNESKSGCNEKDQYAYISEQDWKNLEKGSYTPAGSQRAWKVIRDISDFNALAAGKLNYDGPIFASPMVANTIQQARQAEIVGSDSSNPSGTAYIKTVPTLETMTKGALQQLGKNKSGLFLMVEGGATDWSAHTSSCGTEWSYGVCTSQPEYGRLIEETQDFNNAVAAVIQWVERYSNWNDTLLIVTTDHDNSMPMGANAQTIPFELVKSKGIKVMPEVSFRPTGNHSNALVPLWAKGAGSEWFAKRVTGKDAGYEKYMKLNDGSYINNTDVYAVMKAALQGKTVEQKK